MRETPRDIILKRVSDQLTVQSSLYDFVSCALLDDEIKRHSAFAELLHRTQTILRTHIGRLEQHLKHDLVYTEQVRSPVTGPIGTITQICQRYSADPVSCTLRDCYSALCVQSLTYNMLHAAALALQAPLTAELALEHLVDLPPLILEMNQIAPSVAVNELKERNLAT